MLKVELHSAAALVICVTDLNSLSSFRVYFDATHPIPLNMFLVVCVLKALVNYSTKKNNPEKICYSNFSHQFIVLLLMSFHWEAPSGQQSSSGRNGQLLVARFCYKCSPVLCQGLRLLFPTLFLSFLFLGL